jgi:hypothetical protein
LFYQASGWDRKYLPKRRIIATILRSVINQKSYNIRKGHCFHNNLIKYRRRQRQQGCGQTYSNLWLPQLFSIKKETIFGQRYARTPLYFWLLSCVIYIGVKSSSRLCAANFSYLIVCVCVFDVFLFLAKRTVHITWTSELLYRYHTQIRGCRL